MKGKACQKRSRHEFFCCDGGRLTCDTNTNVVSVLVITEESMMKMIITVKAVHADEWRCLVSA